MSGWRSPWALLLAVLVLKSAGFAFGVLNIDESDYMLAGATILRGEIPYRDLVEIKPPLGYLTYVPAGLFGGQHILPMRVIAALWIWATALVLGAAARRWTDDPDAGPAASWLALLAGLCEVPSFGSEVMMNLPVAGALYFWVRARKEDRAGFDALCGTCIGLASLYRHQGAAAGVAFGLALLWQARRDARVLGRLALVAATALIPWALAAGIYSALGALPDFVDWAIARNFAYAGKGAAGSAFARFAQSTFLCAGVAAVAWWLAARRSFRPGDSAGLGLAILLWFTWIPISLGGRFYEHYYLQFVPPLAVLGAPGLVELARRWRSVLPRVRAAVLASVAISLLASLGFSWGRGLAGKYPAQEKRSVEIGQWLRSHSAPAERIFVWGHYTPIYTLSQRLPGTRYYNTSVHMGNFDPEHLPASFEAAAHRSDRDVKTTLQDLERRRPEWVVDTAPADIHSWARIPLTAFPDLAAYIEANYAEVARPGGARVLRRRGLQSGVAGG